MGFYVEERLLLACLNLDRDADGAARLAALVARPVSWRYFLRAAELNGLLPLVRRNLRESGAATAIPHPVMQGLDRGYHKVAFKNHRLYADLATVLAACRRSGIEVIALKGAAFAESLWGNIALRPMDDLDLLVREADLHKADRLLTGLGYTYWPDWGGTERHHHLRPYCNAETGTTVEIHRHIARPPFADSWDLDGLWARALPLRIAGVEGRVLCPEDALIHLCVHQCHHDPFTGKLKNLLDLRRLLQLYEDQIDWDHVVHQAQEGTAAYAYYPLCLAKELLGVTIPASVLARLREGCHGGALADGLVKMLARHNLFYRPGRPSLIPGWLTLAVSSDLLTDAPLGHKLRAVVGTCFVPSGPDADDRHLPLFDCARFALLRCAKLAQQAMRLARRRPA
jgi:hypothetical protein